MTDTATPVVIPSGRYRKGAVWGWILGILVVLFGGYVAAQWFLSDRVPGGAVVAGVDIGGLNRADAIATVESKLGAQSRQPIAVHAGTAQTTLDPVGAGIRFDAAETVEQLTEFSLNPARLVTHLRGEYGEVPLAVEIDNARFQPAASRAAQALAQDPVDGTVVFTDGQAATTAARIGQTVSTDAIAEAVTQRWLHQEGVLEVEAVPVAPQITQAATDAAFTLARQIAGGPIRVEVDGQTFNLPASTMAEATSFRARAGELVPEFNTEKLTSAVLDLSHNLIREPADAYFEFVEGRPVIVAAQNGTTLDPQSVLNAVETAALSGSRVAAIELIEEPPELTTADLEALGINEVVSTFGTALTADRIRTGNLRRGAELLNGVLVKPGETFSLMDAINPINAANGFANAPVIVAGNLTDGMGGGLSQLATTAYNAGFFAGFEDVESRPHSLFINRYPAGREATLVTGSLDMKFRNNTPYGALIQSWISSSADGCFTRNQWGCIHVAIWSTPYFRVETQMSERTEVVQPETEERSGPQCNPQGAGQPGFVVSNSRQVFRLSDNEQVINETNRWRYRPTNRIVCVG